MKKILLLVSVFAMGTTFAQTDFTLANETEVGTYTYFVCDSSANTYADVTGNNVTWDYSDLAKYIDADGGDILNTLVIDSITNSQFPGAEIAFEIQGLMNDFRASTDTTKLRYGMMISEPSFGSIPVVFDSPALIMNYPFALDDTATDNVTAEAQTDFMNLPASGTQTAKYDGYGTFKIGDTVIQNVSRVHHSSTITVDASFLFGIIDVTFNQYEYYALETSNEPIFTVVSTSMAQQGSSTPMLEQTLVISKYEPAEEMELPVPAPDETSVNNAVTVDFKLAPNPVKDELFISGDFQDATVQIVDHAGKVVFNGTATNGSVISTSNLTNGIYFVKATVDGQNVTQKIVKL